MGQHKILYVAPNAKGGAAVVMYNLIERLDREAFEPLVFLERAENTNVERMLARLEIPMTSLDSTEAHRGGRQEESSKPRRNIGAWIVAKLGRWAGDTYFFFHACYFFIRLEAKKIAPISRMIRDNRISLVHVNNGLTGKAAILAAKLAGVPCVCHVHMFQKLNYLDVLFSKIVTHFIYISNAILDDHTSQGIAHGKGKVIHNGVDVEQYQPAGDTAGFCRTIGCGAEDRLVGLIGRLDHWKGHEYFVEAIGILAQDQKDIRAIIVGEMEDDTPRNRAYCRRVNEMIVNMKLEDNVIFSGFREDIPEVMSAMDVVVLSSSQPEPFGMVIIEAMAASKPVVATAAGGVLDIIEDNVTGLLVPPKSGTALADAIGTLLANPLEAKKIGEAAHQAVAERFSLERQAAETTSVYKSCLDDRATTWPAASWDA